MNAEALDATVRRFPRILAIARRCFAKGCDWCLTPRDAQLVRDEYARVIGDLVKARRA